MKERPVASHQSPASEAVELNAGNSSRASHVWRVEGPDGPLILRRSWWTTPEVSAFMLGLSRLFGVDPRDLRATAGAYRFWQELNVWAVPAVREIREFLGSPALAVEFVPGEAARDLQEVDAAELGRRVAAVHAWTSEGYGPVTGASPRPLPGFYAHALEVVREVAGHFDASEWQGHWPQVAAAFQSAPAPTHAVPTLLDWCGAQFVWRGGQPFALVDVEASAFAPPELDLSLWEVLLTRQGARAFRAGYGERLPFPDLRPHRTACRLILRALEVEGSPPLEEWLALPHHFGGGGP